MQHAITRAIPTASQALKALLLADLRVQWRNRRALLMTMFVPIVFVISWKSLVPEIGGANVLSICIAIGLPAVGLMGYSASLARDRERGIFQRLRAAPIPTGAIMLSRILVQLSVIAAMTLVTCLAAYAVDGIAVSLPHLVVLVIASAIGGLAFLALGQFVVAFIISTDAVNAATRLLYFPIAIVGALGQIGLFGQTVENIVVWSPLGTTKTMLAAALDFGAIDSHAAIAVLVTLAYGAVFAFFGIRNFRWTMQ